MCHPQRHRNISYHSRLVLLGAVWPDFGCLCERRRHTSSGTCNPIHAKRVPPFSLDFVRWAWAQSYCTGGAIGSSQAIAPSSISDQWADGCTLTAGVQLTLSGVNMPNGESSAGSVAMRFASGTVQSQGFIVVQGPPLRPRPKKCRWRCSLLAALFSAARL